MKESLFFLVQVLAIPVFSPLLIGVIRVLKARLQNRVGASILQPYRDLWKLFHKDEVISTDASWITRYAPYLIFSLTVLMGVAVPLVTLLPAELVGADGMPMLSFLPIGDFIVFVSLGMLATFFLALIGLDQGSAFGGFGSSREMMMAALAEGGLFFSLFAVSIASQSGNIGDMASRVADLPFVVFLPLLIAFLGFFIVLLAENARFPFDNPATHLELTMIHEAMILDLSGKRLALLEWAAANKLLFFVALGASLFFPWGLSTSLDVSSLVLATLLSVVKILFFALLIVFVESFSAKFRIFRLPDVLFTAFVLSVISIAIMLGAYV